MITARLSHRSDSTRARYGSVFVSQAPLGYRVGRRGRVQLRGTAVWTDYPLLPHERGKRAPIRRVRALCWDGNKYALIRWGSRLWDLKVGYLYPEPGRCGDVPSIPYGALPEGDWMEGRLEVPA